MTHAKSEQINCTECDLSLLLPNLGEREKALCPRCGYLLTVNHPESIERILAFAFTALIFLILSLSFDFVSISYQGQTYTITLLDTYFRLTEQNYFIIALVLMLTVIVLPLVVISALFYLLFHIQAQRYPQKGLLLAKCLSALLPWSMAEIFLIGVLVSLIKISTMTHVILGLSFYAYVLFAISYIAAIQYIDKNHLLLILRQLKLKVNLHLHNNSIVSNAIEHKNKQDNTSIQKTWALIITSLFLYFPANLLPIMTTRSLGKEELNTILGGVIVLWRDGSYPVAIIIFIASIVVPIIKFIILAWLNYSVQQQETSFQLQRAQLYRITEFVGRWSMIDIFAVAILASLIQLGTAMTIHPGPAAIAFCGVVILTMLAANTFDSTLIWKKTLSHE
ncbi:MAG: paraquat-inducible protein A [Alteromonadaceae bacterium]|nr:paraquat-inducible protein A [Alteromonadaceae bacterium]